MAGHILSRFNYLIGSLNIRIKCFDLFLGMAGHILSSVLRAEQMYHCFEDLAVTNCFFFKLQTLGYEVDADEYHRYHLIVMP